MHSLSDWDCEDMPEVGRGHHHGGRYGGFHGSFPIWETEPTVIMIDDPSETWGGQANTISTSALDDEWPDYVMHRAHVGATSTELTPPDQTPWYLSPSLAAETADRKYRALEGDINNAVLNTPVTAPNYAGLATLQTEYSLWLAKWEETYTSGDVSVGPGFITYGGDADPTSYEPEYQIFADRYQKLTGQALTPTAPAQSPLQQALGQAKTAMAGTAASGATSALSWKVWLALGAVVGFGLLWVNAKVAGGVQRSFR